jgi:hypothetical protein
VCRYNKKIHIIMFETDAGRLCAFIVLVVIVLVIYDKVVLKSGMKSGWNQGPTLDSQMYGPSNQEYSYDTYTGFAGANAYRDQGAVNPYTLSRYSN